MDTVATKDTPPDAPALELSEAFLRRRRNVKWRQYAEDVLPAFIAEMDFAIAGPIQAAMAKIVAEEDYGYAQRNGERADMALARAFCARMRSSFGWETKPELVQTTTELVQPIFLSILAFSDPGDGVVLQLPVYPPFRAAVSDAGRRSVVQTFRDDGGKHVFDPDELARLIDPNTKVFLLCNPQNPTGRVFTRDELEVIARLAVERDLVVVSDEVHSDLAFPGHTHIPLATLGPEIAARTVTITSASKAFNIPGLRSAVMYFGSPELKARFHGRFPARTIGHANAFGIDATVAAWSGESDPWLVAVRTHLVAARDRMLAVLAAELPEIVVRKPEATYLAWLDCGALGLPEKAFSFFHDRARIAFSPGETFHPEKAHCVRLNFATSYSILDQILERMIAAVRAHRS